MAFFLAFSGYALTSKTTRNAIQGSAPYLTFDNGRTRVADTNGLLGIMLSDGTQYTPLTNPSSTTPIVLPVAGQSFADIGMLVPTDTNSVALSALIGPPNNYWGDDDGDSGVTATGRLSLSIVDKNNESVSRSTVPTICKAPYKVTLSSTNGTLSTRYGFPNRSTFSARSETYYVNPTGPAVCFARPNLERGTGNRAGPVSMWDPNKGFLTQKTDPLYYGQNFPTTGANGLYFDLDISGSSQPLSWSPVSQGGITVTMSNSTATSVRVTLTGPYATTSQHNSDNPGRISTPSLPQTFELVGRDSQGNPVAKYGFTLKQWFVNRGNNWHNYSNSYYWCRSLGYNMPYVMKLTSATECLDRNYSCNNALIDAIATYPYASYTSYRRYIGAGFFSEWGKMEDYSGVGFNHDWYWAGHPYGSGSFMIDSNSGSILLPSGTIYGLCVYP